MAKAVSDMTQEANDKVDEVVDQAVTAEEVDTEGADQETSEAVDVEVEETAAESVDAEDWQGRFMRLHAEWDTYRRRMEEQRTDERMRAGENFVSSMLPVLDDFERSIDYAEKNGEAGLLDGVKQVHTKLLGVLEKGGVQVLDPVGSAFDALEHQAVATVDRSDVPDETVDQVYQKGYKMGRKVIRPAMVTVTTGGPKREVPERE